MYVYRIGYGTCEESDYDYLIHKEKFSKEQLTSLIHDCVLDVLMEAKEKKKNSDMGSPYLHSYQDIHGEVVEKLIKKHGFEELRIEQSWDVFGWASIFIHGDWSGYREEPDDLTALVKAIRKAGYTRRDDGFLSFREEINKSSRELKGE